jgi:hypothetical protein
MIKSLNIDYSGPIDGHDILLKWRTKTRNENDTGQLSLSR